MPKARLRAVGGSVMVAIPPPLLAALDLTADTEVQLKADGKRLVIEPLAKRGRIGLAARLKMCDFSKPISEEERAWLDSPRAGREEI